MQEIFSLEDVLNVMISLEKNGSEHYLKMEENSKDLVAKALFSKLAKQEQIHQEIYSKMKEQSITFVHSEMEKEYQEYLNSLLEETIRFLQAPLVSFSAETGFEVAIQLEKDTLLLLAELKHIMKGQVTKEIDDIMDQERGHLKALYQYKSNFESSGNF
ncbi:MAG: hypothetical protein JW708_07655 [Vallitaleaceae bacterium]|nr:hypothetical protein [Vallitaleaceae bacterium]